MVFQKWAKLIYFSFYDRRHMTKFLESPWTISKIVQHWECRNLKKGFNQAKEKEIMHSSSEDTSKLLLQEQIAVNLRKWVYLHGIDQVFWEVWNQCSQYRDPYYWFPLGDLRNVFIIRVSISLTLFLVLRHIYQN